LTAELSADNPPLSKFVQLHLEFYNKLNLCFKTTFQVALASLSLTAELRADNPPLSKFPQLHFLFLNPVATFKPSLSASPQPNFLILPLTAPLRADNPPLSKFPQLH